MKFTCDICNYQTEDKSNINRHNKSSRHLKKAAGESTKKLFKCTECDYESYNWSNYNKHQQSHKGERKYVYHCKACNKGFKDNFNLSIHYKSSKHKDNVIEKFPDTVIQKLTGVRLDLTKKHQYITKLTKTVVCDEKKVRKKQATKEVIINTKDYLPPEQLDDKKKRNLITKAISWLRDNGVDPDDEGYSEENELDENYKVIYELMTDDIIGYFKGTLGITPKNITKIV